MSIKESQLQDLNDLYLQIALCAELDFEVNINGNGRNAYEVKACIDEVFDILKLERPEITDEMQVQFLNELGMDPADFGL